MTAHEIANHYCYDGLQKVFNHESTCCQCEMTFAVYLPPQARQKPVPVIWWLSGLTCTHENAMVKGGLQQFAAKYGLAIIFPDTSPRGENVPNDEASDMGQGASFYVNATEAPWRDHFQMYTYIVDELPQIIADTCPEIDLTRQAISGHSMGGHGALTIGLNNTDRFRSISAFAPMTNPSAQSEWGQKQFQKYLGENPKHWEDYDACQLLKKRNYNGEILIDQGSGDNFYDLLQPENINKAAEGTETRINLRLRESYDHSYFFVTTFAESHFKWHAEKLNK